MVLQITLFTRYSVVTVAINNRYLDCGLILFVKDNHADKIKTLRKFGVCIFWLDCKQSTQRYGIIIKKPFLTGKSCLLYSEVVLIAYCFNSGISNL